MTLPVVVCFQYELNQEMWWFFKNILHTHRRRHIDAVVGRTEKCVVLFDTHAAFKRVSVVYVVWREKKTMRKIISFFLKSVFPFLPMQLRLI